MSCLGVHFALTAPELDELRAIADEDDRLEHLQEVLEPRYLETLPELAAESDKSWDAMHRVLSGGTLSWDGGSYPLNHVVLAGERLYLKDSYIMTAKSPAQVRDIAAALPAIDEGEFRRRYDRIDPREYGFPLDDDDFEYTWSWFQDVRALYLRAAREGRPVLFTADQ